MATPYFVRTRGYPYRLRFPNERLASTTRPPVAARASPSPAGPLPRRDEQLLDTQAAVRQAAVRVQCREGPPRQGQLNAIEGTSGTVLKVVEVMPLRIYV
jgi:hypothetical protein